MFLAEGKGDAGVIKKKTQLNLIKENEHIFKILTNLYRIYIMINCLGQMA